MGAVGLHCHGGNKTLKVRVELRHKHSGAVLEGISYRGVCMTAVVAVRVVVDWFFSGS